MCVHCTRCIPSCHLSRVCARPRLTCATSTHCAYHLVIVEPVFTKNGRWPPPEHLTQQCLSNPKQLAKLDAVVRERADNFLRLRHPNPLEAELLQQFLGHSQYLSFHPFRYLVLFEWNPLNGSNGQGDAVFADGNGNLAVLEAKAQKRAGPVTQQSHRYAELLRGDFPDATVYSAIVNKSGFKWTCENPYKKARKGQPKSQAVCTATNIDVSK